MPQLNDIKEWEEPRFEAVCEDLRSLIAAIDRHNEQEVELLQESMLVDDGGERGRFGVPAGFALTITNPNVAGTLYFTITGADPRSPGGNIAPTALVYSAPVVMNSPTLVCARVLSGGQWSALVEAVFYPPQDLSALSLTEIMYHPAPVGGTNGDEFEFIELKNRGADELNLSGLAFTSGITFTFTNGTMLAPDGFFVLVRNPEQFTNRYPGDLPRGL